MMTTEKQREQEAAYARYYYGPCVRCRERHYLINGLCLDCRAERGWLCRCGRVNVSDLTRCPSCGADIGKGEAVLQAVTRGLAADMAADVESEGGAE